MKISPKAVAPSFQSSFNFSILPVTPPLIPKSTIDFLLASLSFCSKARLSVVGGTVLGWSITVVIPPAAAAQEPVYQFSFKVIPGSLKWTCTSIPAGRVRAPPASIIVSELETLRSFPILVTLPSSIMISAG